MGNHQSSTCSNVYNSHVKVMSYNEEMIRSRHAHNGHLRHSIVSLILLFHYFSY